MTRETKIGLLVGLAFIIVIGILLSDYNRIESPNAPLYQVTKDVSGSKTTPETPGRTTIVYPPKPVTPHQTVPTVADLAPQNNTPDEVVVRPGLGQLPPHDEITSRGVVVGPGNSIPGDTQSLAGIPSGLQNAVRNGDLVPVNQGKDKSALTQKSTPTSPAIAGKQYTAEAGDTVSKMAGRFMGGNTKANRDAIVAANPSLQKNINNVIVGRVYVIPGASTASGTQQAAPAPKMPQVALAPVTQAPVNQPQATPTHWYTVKENDSLWRIAQEQMGDGNAVASIKELNKDVLKGGDNLRPNMRLRLPAKPLASAN